LLSSCLYLLSLHDALPIFYRAFVFPADVVAVIDLPICGGAGDRRGMGGGFQFVVRNVAEAMAAMDRGGVADGGEHRRVDRVRFRSEEHTSELQSLRHLVCR